MNTHERFEDHEHDRPVETPGAGASPETPGSGIRPLGFWLKVVDRRIAAELDAALADRGVTRRDWRRLNLVAGEVRDERLEARLAARPHKLDDLVERGWVTGGPGAWSLTDSGRGALDALTTSVQAVRERVRSAVSDEEYATTVASLEAIARELGWDGSTPEPGRRRGRRVPGFGAFGRRSWMHHGDGARRGLPPRAVDESHDHDRWRGQGHGHRRGPGWDRRREDVHVHVHLHHDDPAGGGHGHVDPRRHRDHHDRHVG
ncbi:hypothetical protein [Agromyces sp. ZXT2-3]|uniref:hypothetical protein n=1 Tax=Agromyces sp. ZXT2-3 TaxID=3461152 RepID=UPI004054A3D1